MKRRRWVLTVVALGVVAVIGAGFWFATQFQSPAQQEADAAAPPAGPVFADVTQGSLVGEITFSGEIGPSTQSTLAVLPIPDASLSVVTGRALQAGATVETGQVLTEVNGRPLHGLFSAFSFYRDMGVGDRGPDVSALQAALAARGYPVNADGRFGTETAAAVSQWYRDSGYEAPTRAAAETNTTGSAGGDTPTNGATPAPVAKAPAAQAYVPVAEILAMPAASVRVVQGLSIGQRLAAEGTPDLILGSPDVVVTVTAAASELGDVVAGDPATISIDGVDIDGVVGDIRSSAAPETPDARDAGEQPAQAAAPEITFVVSPGAALPVATGRARVTVTKHVVAESALIVPVLAVSDRGPDQNVVTIRSDDGSLLEVPVTVLGTLQGAAAVAPVEAGALATGDRVRVG